jgi:PTS system sucrose-specific IIC component
VILVAFLAAWLEKRLHKLIPTVFDLFLTPLLTFLLAGVAAIFVLQPLGGAISSAIGAAATGAVGSGGAAVGFVLGGMWLPMVMMGIHQALTPIHADLISQFGVTILLPILAMAGAGQVGAAIAVYVKSKNKFLKKTVASALPVGLMGVGEPLIYGVTLPLGRPFIGACIGGAFGGAVQAHFMVGASAMGISGLPLAGTTNNIPIYLLGVVVAYIAGFIATYLLGFDDPVEEKES